MTQTTMGTIRFVSPAEVETEVVADRYDREANVWDDTLSRLGFHRAYRRLIVSQWRELETVPDARILDVGTGTGAAAISFVSALRSRGPGSCTVTGLDSSEQMLRQTSMRMREAGIPFSPIRGIAEELPFAVASFDVVLAAHVLEHSPRPLRAMAEIDRVLKPGGRAVIMMTRCSPITIRIQKRWAIQCARSRKLESVFRDFGYSSIQTLSYPGSPIASLISFCCIATKPTTSVGGR